MRFYDIAASTDDTPEKVSNSCSIFLYVDIYVCADICICRHNSEWEAFMKTGKVGITLHC